MNEKGEPNWLMIEPGKPTEVLAEAERKDCCRMNYQLLCLEGEEVDEELLLRILCSFIHREIEGWSSTDKDILNFVNDMKKHRVAWNKDRIGLHFRISKDYEHEGKYSLSVRKDFNDGCLGFADDVEDLDKLLELLDDFCSMLEDFVYIEKVVRYIDISRVDGHEFDKELLNRFDRVMK
jgi:hypothetical protein